MANYASKTTSFWWTISAVLTKVAQVRSIRRDGSNQTIDTTNLDSTALEFVGDLPDNGQISLELVFDPANATHTALHDDFKTATKRVARIIFSDAGATQRNFSAFVLSWSEGAVVRDALRVNVTLQIDGAVT